MAINKQVTWTTKSACKRYLQQTHFKVSMKLQHTSVTCPLTTSRGKSIFQIRRGGRKPAIRQMEITVHTSALDWTTSHEKHSVLYSFLQKQRKNGWVRNENRELDREGYHLLLSTARLTLYCKKKQKKNRCECWIYTLQWSDTIFIWCIKLSCSCGLAQLLVCLHYENITAKIWPEIICDSWDLLKEPLSLINTAFWLARSLRRQKALDQQKERETVDFLWQKL